MNRERLPAGRIVADWSADCQGTDPGHRATKVDASHGRAVWRAVVEIGRTGLSVRHGGRGQGERCCGQLPTPRTDFIA